MVGLVIISWHHHVTDGLIVTNMSDHVSWGIGIANFVYFVGVAAGAAVLVVPAYAYTRSDIKESRAPRRALGGVRRRRCACSSS